MEEKQMFGINGMEQNDAGALTPEQQQKLNDFKINTRFANEKYLRGHPEVSCLLTGFLGSILRERPENVREFASKYFSDPELNSKVEAQVAELNSRIKKTNRP
ncbi:RIIa domain-containing protein 1-like [Orbicella faveolata]|uniref:RIIa domain-containing protein 1-like n=1 Tax=Orbicella faveolata TaxID=48498 RepID=UPI0009E31C90|nr:RIIa domain-containing protein 1-like [Orbicella faveolata]